MGDLLADEPLPDPNHSGRYRLPLDATWTVLYLLGGASTGVALRAMNRHIGDVAKRLVSARAVFIAPLEPGELVIDVDTLRSSRSVDHLEASVRQDESSPPALRVSGIWGNHSADPVTGDGLVCPEVPGPDQCEPIVHHPAFAYFPIHTHFNERHCSGWSTPEAFFDDPTTAESAVWARLNEAHTGRDGTFDPSVLALLADRAPGPHLGPTITNPTQGRPMVSLDLSIRMLAEPASEWMLLHSKVIHAGGRYITTRVAFWDQDATLVAIADQTARFASLTLQAPEQGNHT